MHGLKLALLVRKAGNDALQAQYLIRTHTHNLLSQLHPIHTYKYSYDIYMYTYKYIYRMKLALLVRMGEKDVLEALAVVRNASKRMFLNYSLWYMLVA